MADVPLRDRLAEIARHALAGPSAVTASGLTDLGDQVPADKRFA